MEDAPKKKRGRQPLDPSQKRVQITFTLTPELLQRATASAKEHNMSRTTFINLALDNACKYGLNPMTKEDVINFLKEIKG